MKTSLPFTHIAMTLAMVSLLTICQSASAQSAREILAGKWKVDWDKSAELTDDKQASASFKSSGEAGASFEIHIGDRSFVTHATDFGGGKAKTRERRWRVLKSDGRDILLETVDNLDRSKIKMQITVLDGERITYALAADSRVIMALRRVN